MGSALSNARVNLKDGVLSWEAVLKNLILFGLLSLMLLIGTLLRAKVKLFQDYLVPASIIGGLIGFAIVSTGWLKIGEWQITSSSFNWFLFHAFNISYISLLLTRPRGNQENTSKEVVRGGHVADADLDNQPSRAKPSSAAR